MRGKKEGIEKPRRQQHTGEVKEIRRQRKEEPAVLHRIKRQLVGDESNGGADLEPEKKKAPLILIESLTGRGDRTPVTYQRTLF